MNVILAKTDTGRAPGDIFILARDRLSGGGKVTEARRQAFAAYEHAGLPHRRIEEWKYTDLRAQMREVLSLAPAPDVAALERARAALQPHAVEGAAKLVLVDGMFAPGLSDLATLEAPVSVRTLRETLEKTDGAELLTTGATDAVISLNAAMATDGVVVGIADGAALSRPIQILHVATTPSASAFTRSRLQIGK